MLKTNWRYHKDTTIVNKTINKLTTSSSEEKLQAIKIKYYSYKQLKSCKQTKTNCQAYTLYYVSNNNIYVFVGRGHTLICNWEPIVWCN